MTALFDVSGDNLDIGYVNIRAGEARPERELRTLLEQMWQRYEPYADPDFRHGFAREPEARFWEMYLGCTLLDAGKTLLLTKDRPRTGGQPDLCVLEDGRRIWIEAITPDKGDPEKDGIPDIVPLNEGGGVVAQPKRQIHLRITSALLTKSRAIARYRSEGVISRDDVSLVAIGAGDFGAYASGGGMPLALSAVFPIGNEYFRVNRETLDVVGRGHHLSLNIERKGGDIPRRAFLDERFNNVSALLWSRAGLGNMNRKVRKLSLIHNPLAVNRMPIKWGVWDREFVASQTESGWLLEDVLS